MSLRNTLLDYIPDCHGLHDKGNQPLTQECSEKEYVGLVKYLKRGVRFSWKDMLVMTQAM